MCYIKCDKPLFLPWREFLCFVLIISVRRASYAKGQRMIFNINIYTWLNSEGGKAKQLWTLLKGLRNPTETVFESICQESSIIIASYQVILIFDNVFFSKNLLHRVRRLSTRFGDHSTGYGYFPKGSWSLCLPPLEQQTVWEGERVGRHIILRF